MSEVQLRLAQPYCHCVRGPPFTHAGPVTAWLHSATHTTKAAAEDTRTAFHKEHYRNMNLIYNLLSNLYTQFQIQFSNVISR